MWRGKHVCLLYWCVGDGVRLGVQSSRVWSRLWSTGVPATKPADLGEVLAAGWLGLLSLWECAPDELPLRSLRHPGFM